MVSGVLLQIYNIPIDIKIENYIFDNYPGLRKSQILYLEQDSKVLLSACNIYDPNIISHHLKKYFEMSLAISYVYLKSLAPILGTHYKKVYKKHKDIVALGKSINELMIDDLGGNEDVKGKAFRHGVSYRLDAIK